MSECRVCLTPDSPQNLISPCHCKGSVKFIHQSCLQNWLREKFRRQYKDLLKRNVSGGTGLKCELCHSEFHGELTNVSMWQCLKTVFSSQTSYYIALNIPVIIYLGYKFHKVFWKLLYHFKYEAIRIMSLRAKSMSAKVLALLRLYIRVLLNSVPVAVFGSALPVFIYNTVALMQLLSLECKQFKIRSQACMILD